MGSNGPHLPKSPPKSYIWNYETLTWDLRRKKINLFCNGPLWDNLPRREIGAQELQCTSYILNSKSLEWGRTWMGRFEAPTKNHHRATVLLDLHNPAC